MAQWFKLWGTHAAHAVGVPMDEDRMLPQVTGSTLGAELSSPFMTHFLAAVGFPELTKGLDIAVLCELVGRPRKEDAELARLGPLFETEFLRVAQDIRLAEHTDRPILVQLGSDGESIERGKYFRAPQTLGTIARYSRWMCGVVVLLIRSERWVEGAKPYTIAMSIPAQRALSRLRHALVGKAGELQPSDGLWTLIRSLLMTLLTDDTVGVRLEDMSAAQHYVMLSHLKPNGQWDEVRTMPPKLAGLTWGFRAVAFDDMSERRDGKSRVRLFGPLQPFLRAGRSTMFGAIRELQACASSFTLAADKKADFEWLSADTLSWNGLVLSLGNVRQVVADLLTRGRNLIVHDLLGGVRPETMGFQPSLDGAVEDSTSSQLGYSFLSDRRNRFPSYHHTVIQHLLTSPTLGGRFHSSVGGELVLDPSACSRFLSTADRLTEILYVVHHIANGQPARGSEEGTYLYANGMLQRRHLRLRQTAEGPTLVIRAEYHKGRHVQQIDKVSAMGPTRLRALPLLLVQRIAHDMDMVHPSLSCCILSPPTSSRYR
ncbi:hypothetical protein CALCODRAFT_559254 [Calocera cornea HHB12733]|uniref:Uncharacterized protein n=1 Tax=Calocera cornea HHB12733 TaxID=1353952 RepID=A0A165C105_9BASI|nr:hypothetical protein CALCODRAFT_559254 [Calocera cornea HHB12733]